MIEIVFSMAAVDPNFWRKVVQDEFNPQHRGQIHINYRNFSFDQYHDELRRMFGGRGRTTDVLGGDVIWTAEFASNGWIVDLTNRFPQSEQQKFLPKTIQANTYQSKIWGVPWFTDVGSSTA